MLGVWGKIESGTFDSRFDFSRTGTGERKLNGILSAMCTYFAAITDAAELLKYFGVSVDGTTSYKDVTWPGYETPIIRKAIRLEQDPDKPLNVDPGPGRELFPARFGLIPPWAKIEDVKKNKLPYATQNARVEDIAKKPAFRHAWKNRQFCIFPVSHIYEPCWEKGTHERMRIWIEPQEPFGVAGIWERWQVDDWIVESASMLTVNADDHPLMNRMHRPGDEKRMVVILDRKDYEKWLNATTGEALALCVQFPADRMYAVPDLEPVSSRYPRK